MVFDTSHRDDEPERPPSLDELYSTAVGASNLKVGRWDGPRTPVDLVLAAGMNRARLGMALRRLRHEWDTSAKPRPMTPGQLDGLAGTYPRLQSGLVRIRELSPLVEVGGKRREVERDVKPLEAARADADHWFANELRILMISLRTLPEIRDAMIFWARGQDIEDGEHAAGAAILWWLDPTCPRCGGGGKRVIAGTGRQSSKDCAPCKGEGKRPVPHGAVGRRLLAYIKSTLGSASEDLKGRFRHHAKPKDGQSGGA